MNCGTKCGSENKQKILEGELYDLVIFGSLGQVKGGINFWSTLLTGGRQFKGDWLDQAIVCLQLELGRFRWDLVEVSGRKITCTNKCLR